VQKAPTTDAALLTQPWRTKGLVMSSAVVTQPVSTLRTWAVLGTRGSSAQCAVDRPDHGVSE
jgi:hypothetical protein